jgi:hypothetical protein
MPRLLEPSRLIPSLRRDRTGRARRRVGVQVEARVASAMFSFGSAMAAGVGDLLDGWANRDIDIDAFGSAVAQHFVPWAQSHDKFT